MASVRGSRRWPLRSLGGGLVVALLAGPAGADEPVLHEYFARDDAEDLALGATTPDGRLAAAIATPTGIVPAPTPGLGSLSRDHVYGRDAAFAAEDGGYRVDRNTSRPDSVGYDDPFTPSVTPFKRDLAYDTVDEHLELRIADRSLHPLRVGGTPRADEDQFYADLAVSLDAGQAVRIPTVGAGTRPLALQSFPETAVELLHDGADNWFVRSGTAGRIRLTMQLAIPRAVFGSAFADIPYSALPAVPPLPAPVAEAADRVLARLGVNRRLRPRDALAALVGYFRGFSPSDEFPDAADPVALYEQLALSRKGVCRHRAYAFVVTALELGIPTRFVRNEAHAWVEVNDGQLWHRVDLGGAAGHLEIDPAAAGFQHVPPPDPTPWPVGAESATELARRAAAELGTGRSAARPGGPGALGLPGIPAPSPAATPAPGLDPREPAVVTLELLDRTVRRGEPLALRGTLRTADGPCAGARIDVSLRREGAAPVPLGSLPTRRDGTYSGAVTLRFDADTGAQEVEVSTPGTVYCGPASAR